MNNVIDLGKVKFTKEIHKDFKRLEEDGFIKKTGEIRNGEDVWEITEDGKRHLEQLKKIERKI